MNKMQYLQYTMISTVADTLLKVQAISQGFNHRYGSTACRILEPGADSTLCLDISTTKLSQRQRHRLTQDEEGNWLLRGTRTTKEHYTPHDLCANKRYALTANINAYTKHSVRIYNSMLSNCKDAIVIFLFLFAS